MLLAMATAVGVFCTLIMPGASTDVAAYWSDTSKVTAAPVQLGPLPVQPARSGGTGLLCTEGPGLIVKSLGYAWKSESRLNTPLVYSAKVTLAQGQTSFTKDATVSVVTGTNNRSVTIEVNLIQELLNSLKNLLGSILGTYDITVTITAQYPGAMNWNSVTTATGKYNTGVAGLLSSFSCK